MSRAFPRPRIGALMAVLALFGPISCNTPEAPAPVRSAGPNEVQTRSLPLALTSLEVQDGIDIELIYDKADTARQVLIEGPANLLPRLHLHVDDKGRAQLSDGNRFRWVRRPIHYQVRLPVGAGFVSLTNRGFGTIDSPDTLRMPYLEARVDGVGPVRLTVACQRVSGGAGAYGGLLEVSGRANSAYFYLDRSARLEAAGLTLKHAELYQDSDGSATLTVRSTLRGRHTGRGPLQLTQRPDTVIVTRGPGAGPMIINP